MHVRIVTYISTILLLVIGRDLAAQSSLSPLAKMTVEQKVGQTLIWSFQGTEVTPSLEESLNHYQIGGIIFFKRNIATTDQIAKLNQDLQKLAKRSLKAPLFLMIDQEGGVVTRIRVNTPLPSALALGSTRDSSLIHEYAKANGDLLLGLGFNFNLAPVLDLSDSKKDTFIGNRSFGGDPQQVTELAMAYTRGLSSSGLVPTAKHFPGHGGEINDTHHTQAQKFSGVEELQEQDWVPFKEFAGLKFPRAIMTSHLALPHVDEQGTVATFSPTIVKTWLRENLGFNGLIITDDLEMAGASGVSDIGERAVRAFLAGHDMLMLAGPTARQRKAARALIEAVKSGRISEARLNESVQRILDLKNQAKLESIKIDNGKSRIAIRKLQNLSRDIMQKNFKTALLNQPITWPAVMKSTRTIVFSSQVGFVNEFKRKFVGKVQHFLLTPESLTRLPEELAKDSLPFAIFYASGTGTAQGLNALNPALKSKVIVVNCNTEGKIDDQSAFMGVINLNSHSPESGGWLAAEMSAPRLEDPATAPEDIRTPAGENEDQ